LPLKWIFSLLLVLVVLVLGALWWAWSDLNRYGDRPLAALGEQKVFEIRPGANLKAIAHGLARAGFIRNPFKFQLLARLHKLDRRLKAGEYLLSARQSPLQILEDLVDGRVMLHKLTIPEGYTLAQIVALASRSGLAGAKGFEKELTDPRYARQLGIKDKSLEGYLFPDTYLFPRQAGAAEMVGAMVDRFRSVFNDPWKKRAADLGFSVHQIVTLASIVEKETGQAGERPLISAVFHNRLKKKMRLESDPTVIYGIQDFDGNLTRRHLRSPTAYNTYTIFGLPPGPIASPGKAALEAALFPARSPHLFFVAKKDGHHQFSTNYKDHLRAVRKHQLSPKSR
jgi:UPF0755 protein